MSRIIKFNVWDTKQGKFLENVPLKEAWIDSDSWDDPEEVLEEPYEWQLAPTYNGRLIWLQFTGLQDMEGKDVYEGDILREPPKDEWEENNYSCFEVFFHNGDANSDYNIGFSMNRMHNHGSVCGGYVPSFKPKSLKKMRVIGNIYENPELVKQI